MVEYYEVRDELLEQLGKRGLVEWLKKLPGEYLHAMVEAVHNLVGKETK